MAVEDLQVRDLSLDDHDAALDVRLRSFGALPAGSTTWWDDLFERAVTSGRALGVVAGEQLVASTRIHGYHQLWGGRALPMAGIAGVVVAPEWRGRGVARMLMTASLERAVELGDVLSVLFPAVPGPYRRLGWEMAGACSRTTFPAEALRSLGAPAVGVRRATAADTDTIVELMRSEGERSAACGPLELTPDDVRKLVTNPEDFCYLAADGFVAYSWHGSDLLVERLTAQSHETTRALWALVGSGASIARRVSTYLPAHDPIHWFLDGKAELDVQEDRWMLRVLDARAAVAGRGFPVDVTTDASLTLVDPWLTGCAGSFQLRVSEGSGELVEQEASANAMVLGPNGIGALYAGTPMSTLRGAGLVTCGSAEQDARLDAAFASRPYLVDSF